MARIINTEGPGRERNLLAKGIVAGIRKLAKKTEFDHESKDIISFIILSLEAISKSVDVSVSAWEKRDYWIKADRFRQEWYWANRDSKALRSAFLENDLIRISQLIAEIGKNLGNIKVSEKSRIGTPWVGYQEKIT